MEKWGFGCAPFKPETHRRNKIALTQVMYYLKHEPIASGYSILDEISHVKGMFNRIIRQDQWDWFTTYMYFDYPSDVSIKRIVSLLSGLRNAIKNQSQEIIDDFSNKLLGSVFPLCAENYKSFSKSIKPSDSYIYILSRREEKEILKIGMTTRNVIKRCEEINSATGVLYPFSPRAVFRVKDARLAEKKIHELLADYRVRHDREFFVLPFVEAKEKIRALLNDLGLLYYQS